jgi:hypothetical protein
MHDRLVNEVRMGKRFALIIGCTLASADAFRRSLAWASLSHPIRVRSTSRARYLRSARPLTSYL